MMADGKAGSRKNMAMMYEGKNVEGTMKKVACSIPVLHVKNGYALWGAFFRKHGPPYTTTNHPARLIRSFTQYTSSIKFQRMLDI